MSRAGRPAAVRALHRRPVALGHSTGLAPRPRNRLAAYFGSRELAGSIAGREHLADRLSWPGFGGGQPGRGSHVRLVPAANRAHWPAAAVLLLRGFGARLRFHPAFRPAHPGPGPLVA